MSERHSELNDLLELLCEERLTDRQCAHLEELVLADSATLSRYLHYIDLHGMLHWDAAGGAVPLDDEQRLIASTLAGPAPDEWTSSSRIRRRQKTWITGAAVASVLCLLIGWIAVRTWTTPAGSPGDPVTSDHGLASVGGNQPVVDDSAESTHAVVRLTPRPSTNPSPGEDEIPLPPEEGSDGTPVLASHGDYRSAEAFVSRINERIAAAWTDHEVEPSAVASDESWVRRVHLDIVGRIPDADLVQAFVEDDRDDKRARLVDDLLSGSDFAGHFSTVWSNLLIGHTSPREVNRPALEKFLREQFYRNRPWSNTVSRLVSAEGYEDEDGATNFLLAHLNNEAVPATAVTSRVLLCEQVQCTQCHKHPDGDWKQDRFWELNAFFQQTDIVRHRRTDPKTGERIEDRLELVSHNIGGPTHFEDRQASMHVAYPKYEGVDVDPSKEVDRRKELARLLCAGDNPQIARAMVNRMWAKFFGYGFTTPVDDMGPHNRPSHPELLEELSREFVKSGFDVKQLIRWIVLSDPYQLASLPSESNTIDDPELGNSPLFSRMYVKPLSAEQLFDSLLSATHADRAGTHYWGEAQSRRQQWLEQFYTALDNDENSEAGLFEGSLTQALVMMNGDLIQTATNPKPGTVLAQILREPGSDAEKIRLLSLATLSRYPTPREQTRLTAMVRQHIKSRGQNVSVEAARRNAFRDLMWAYLNSSEFMTNH